MNKWTQKLKKYLIPHEENDYKPHALREVSVLVLAIVILIVFSGSALQHTVITKTNPASVITSVLVDLANKDRLANNLGFLTMNPLLVDAAQRKANDMAENSYFAHTSPAGLTPWHWFQKANYTFLYAGENLAVNFSDSTDVENAWMNSPKHRANILNQNFKEVGIATSQGVYQGKPTIFVVQMFGTPLASAQNIKPIIPVVETEGTDVVVETPIEVAKEEVESIVAGVETSENIETIELSDTFIAVKNIDNVLAQEIEQDTLTQPDNVKVSSIIDRIIASPHRTLNYIYTGLAVLIFIALVLMIFIEIRKQHLLHIFYGVALLVLIVLLAYFAREFIFSELIIL